MRIMGIVRIEGAVRKIVRTMYYTLTQSRKHLLEPAFQDGKALFEFFSAPDVDAHHDKQPQPGEHDENVEEDKEVHFESVLIL